MIRMNQSSLMPVTARFAVKWDVKPFERMILLFRRLPRRFSKHFQYYTLHRLQARDTNSRTMGLVSVDEHIRLFTLCTVCSGSMFNNKLYYLFISYCTLRRRILRHYSLESGSGCLSRGCHVMPCLPGLYLSQPFGKFCDSSGIPGMFMVTLIYLVVLLKVRILSLQLHSARPTLF
jgi:hypothetical protein